MTWPPRAYHDDQPSGGLREDGWLVVAAASAAATKQGRERRSRKPNAMFGWSKEVTLSVDDELCPFFCLAASK